MPTRGRSIARSGKRSNACSTDPSPQWCDFRGLRRSLRLTRLPAGRTVPAEGRDDLTIVARLLPFLAFGPVTLPTSQPAALICLFAAFSFLPATFGTTQLPCGLCV